MPMARLYFNRCLFALLLAQGGGWPLGVIAAEADHSLCPPQFGPVVNWRAPVGSLPTGEMQIDADEVTAEQQEEFHLSGGVELLRDEEHLRADQAWYTRSAERVRAEGNLLYELPGRIIAAESGLFTLDNDYSLLDQAEFWLIDHHLRGSAQSAETRDEVTTLQQARFTSCPDDRNDWYLKASRIELDYPNNIGRAYHARLEFMHVPIFYSPYLDFPLAGRKSGFLAPTLGYGEGSVSEFILPYYWNIAPHRDATIAPRYLRDRGVMWQNQFRYLNPASAGQLEVEYLPNDEISGDNRSLTVWQHNSSFAPGWRGNILYQRVSDTDYLEEFGDSFSRAGTTHLESRADLQYRAAQWWALGRVQEYQTIDDDISDFNKPYQRLPQLLFGYQSSGLGALRYQLNSELVNFEHDTRVTGTRFDIKPSLSWVWQVPAGFLVPTLSYRDTRYRLDENFSGEQETSRSLPLFSLDGGLVFERDLEWGEGLGLQTLEPRLFYLYVPYRNQDDLIIDADGDSQVFDTKLPQFSFAQLFRDNRFSGVDRQADANQLTAALTTRLLDPNGFERLRASIGEIFYFDDRRVTLPGAAEELDTHSDLIGEVAFRPTEFLTSRATLQWDTETHAERGNAQLLYQPDERKLLAMTYYYQRESIRQADLAVMWPISAQWRLLGRWRYSLFDELMLETIRGVEYENCCWTVRLVQRIRHTDVEDPVGPGVALFQIEFKGLNSFGARIEDYVVRDILAR